MIALRSGDARYPDGVRDLASPPDPLWVDGDVSALREPAVAIVGTRRMTGYGERVARELALACARSGIVVVSGFAQGIDSAAHRGALDGGGRTVAVLGESIPTFLVAIRGRRRPLVPRIRERGAIVSEFAAPFGARAWAFAKRNATIAALAAAVVIVEAGEVSGALITARHARALGRALYAIPGPLGSVASVGTNALIASGVARALASVDALVGGAGGAIRDEDPVLEALRDGPLGIDELVRRTRVGTGVTASRIATLLLAGEVVALPDGRVRRP